MIAVLIVFTLLNVMICLTTYKYCQRKKKHHTCRCSKPHEVIRVIEARKKPITVVDQFMVDKQQVKLLGNIYTNQLQRESCMRMMEHISKSELITIEKESVDPFKDRITLKLMVLK